MFCVYILQSQKTKAYYIGCTKSIEVRIEQHNSGKVTSTRKNKPWMIKFMEEHDTLSKARERERQIKNWKSRIAIERLFKK